MLKPTTGTVYSIGRFLYTQNPFYLIGTLLVLFGLQQCLGREPHLAASGLLTGLLAGYTLLLAAIAAVVIRWGQVWDDARTILLVIVLMFFMLSASLDVYVNTARTAGTLYLAAALVFAIVLSEALLRGLKIQLAAQYRAPYYLLLALLFVYPAVTPWLSELGLTSARPWVLFAFPWLAGLALLTLLPAARTPPWHEPASGTPWIWPYYPWSLFVYLTIGVAIRAWWLTISFEPASGQDGYFRPYFLLPLCLGWSALVLEMGRARESKGAMAAGMLLPLLGLCLAFPGRGASLVETTFLSQLAQSLGSPAQLAVAGLLAFYGWAWLRGMRAAEGFLIVTGLAAALVGRETFDFHSLTRPQPLPLAAVAASLLAVAAIQRSAWRAIAAAAMICVGLRQSGHSLGMGDAWFWQWHAPVVALLAITVLFDDKLTRHLRQLAWRGAPVCALIAATVYPWALVQLSAVTLAIYLALLLAMSIVLWMRQKDAPLLAAVVATLAANGLAHVRQVYLLLDQSLLAAGLPWLVGGLAVVLLALLISLTKMGLWQSARLWLWRLNSALGGTK